MTRQTIIDTGETFVFPCPHCGNLTQVQKNQINCQIFRHAVYFITLPPTPHTYTYEYQEKVVHELSNNLIPGKIIDNILNYLGHPPKYIPTEQINPHTSKEKCEELIKKKKVLGCAKPFKIFFSPDGNYVDKCDYI